MPIEVALDPVVVGDEVEAAELRVVATHPDGRPAVGVEVGLSVANDLSPGYVLIGSGVTDAAGEFRMSGGRVDIELGRATAVSAVHTRSRFSDTAFCEATDEQPVQRS